MPLHVVDASCMLHVSRLKLCLKSLQVPLNNKATHNSAYKSAPEMLVVLWSVGRDSSVSWRTPWWTLGLHVKDKQTVTFAVKLLMVVEGFNTTSVIKNVHLWCVLWHQSTISCITDVNSSDVPDDLNDEGENDSVIYGLEVELLNNKGKYS